MKKYFYMSLILLYLLPVSAFLCGCSSSDDGLVLNISDEDAAQAQTSQTPPQESVAAAMTEVSVLEDEPRMVYVYVCGAVKLPGVYCLKEGSRLYEAVEMAGGLADEADDTCLNMARQIIDGEQVVVLTQAEMADIRASGGMGAAEAYAAGVQPAAEADDGRVNINTADKAELTTVSGIGESRAQAIIDYREKNGAFGSIEDIKNVEGIKDGLFSKIKDKIKI